MSEILTFAVLLVAAFVAAYLMEGREGCNIMARVLVAAVPSAAVLAMLVVGVHMACRWLLGT